MLGSYHKLLLLQLTESGGKAYKLLACAPSPRVKLPFRNKEPDFAWAPRDRADMAGNPTVVLEVAVFNESEELLAEGSEWLTLPDTQVSINIGIGPFITWLLLHTEQGLVTGIHASCKPTSFLKCRC